MLGRIHSLGLILDIIAACILVIYGLPSDFKDPVYAEVVIENPDEEQARILSKNKQIKFWSRLGLGVLISGFILQLISNYL